MIEDCARLLTVLPNKGESAADRLSIACGVRAYGAYEYGIIVWAVRNGWAWAPRPSIARPGYQLS
jgi:hypothetical protein